ncbi:hypothetical protein H113_08216, partial [Trichophyton rubrum MR1459]
MESIGLHPDIDKQSFSLHMYPALTATQSARLPHAWTKRSVYITLFMESSLCIYTARLLRMYRDIIREPDIYHKEGYTCSSFRERDLSPGCCPSHLSTPALPQHLDGCSFLLRLSGPTRPPPGERRERYARMSTLSSLHRPFFFYLRFFFFLASLLFFLFAFRLCIFASFSAENCLPAFLYFFFCTLSALCLLFCLPVGS